MNVNRSVSPDTVTETIGGVELGGGWGSGQSCDAVSESVQVAGEGWVAVTAPSVGVFYRRPSPDQAPFVQVGSEVAAKDPVCLIEVMKMFTGVVAPCKGRIADILIEDAAMVEYGQPLMYIEPS